MSTLKTNKYNAYERELDENWAAAYAKRLAGALEAKHDQDVLNLKNELMQMHDHDIDDIMCKLEDELNARADADEALRELIAELTGDTHSPPVLTLATDDETKQGEITSKAVSPHGLNETLSDWFKANVDSSGNFEIPQLSYIGLDVPLTKLMGFELSDSKARADIAELEDAISGLSGTGVVASADTPGQTFDGEVLPVGTIYIQIDPLSLGTPAVTALYICTSDMIMSAEGNDWTQIYPQSGGGGGSEIADGSITTAKLASGAVTEAKIADEAVTGDKIASWTIETNHLGPGIVETDHIADEAVTGDKIASWTIETNHLGPGIVETSHIADNAVTYAKCDSTLKDKIDSGGSAITGLFSVSGNDLTLALESSGDFTFAGGVFRLDDAELGTITFYDGSGVGSDITIGYQEIQRLLALLD